MKQMQLKHWQDPVAALLGAWFAVSPWVLKFQGNNARAVCVTLGVVLLLAGLAAIVEAKPWQHWLAGLIGLIAVVSPWVFGFASDVRARDDAVIVGLVAIVLAAWVLSAQMADGDWGTDRMAR